MAFCLPIEETKKFIQALKDGVIDPAKLSDMSSGERNSFFSRIVGEENATQVNSLFESKLLLKNQQAGLVDWAKKVSGISEKTRFDLLSKINRMDKILTADNEKAFLADLASTKLKTEVTFEEAKKITELSKAVADAKAKIDNTPWKSPERRAYGKKFVEFTKFIEDLKSPTNKLGFKETVKQIGSETAVRFKDKSILGKAIEGVKLVKDIATSAVYKSIQASADLSYSLRQGFKVLATNPRIWRENWIKAFEPFKNIKSQDAMQAVKDAWMADVVSHPLYDKAIQGKLALGIAEEFFPTTLAEKIPGLGNIFKSSNDAFTIFTQGSRLGLFEEMYNTAIKNGAIETSQLLQDIAKVSNSITGRGNLGGLERNAGLVNKIFYSGRYIKSAFDTFTMPFDTRLDPIARNFALKSSIRTIGTMAGMMYVASLFTPVEFDPRSSRFGKYKVPGSQDTWVDLTAGLGSYIHTASSFLLSQTKNTKTGKIQPLNERDKKGNLKFGAQTRFDLVSNWLTGKLAPAPSAAVQYAKGRTYTGGKPTPLNTAETLVFPIAGQNAWSEITSNDDTIAQLISSVSDILGQNSTNYAQINKK